MQIIKKYSHVKNGQIIIKIPKNFKYKKVEVMIYPVDEKKDKMEQSLSEILLNGPTLSKKEIDEWEKALKKMREWKE